MDTEPNSLMVSIPHNDVYYSLEFKMTKPIKDLPKELVEETFESEVSNIRSRLNKLLYGT